LTFFFFNPSLSQLSLNDATKAVWKLPSAQVALHQDLPRLCQRTKVVAKDGSVVSCTSPFPFFIDCTGGQEEGSPHQERGENYIENI